MTMLYHLLVKILAEYSVYSVYTSLLLRSAFIRKRPYLYKLLTIVYSYVIAIVMMYLKVHLLAVLSPFFRATLTVLMTVMKIGFFKSILVRTLFRVCICISSFGREANIADNLRSETLKILFSGREAENGKFSLKYKNSGFLANQDAYNVRENRFENRSENRFSQLTVARDFTQVRLKTDSNKNMDFSIFPQTFERVTASKDVDVTQLCKAIVDSGRVIAYCKTGAGTGNTDVVMSEGLRLLIRLLKLFYILPVSVRIHPSKNSFLERDSFKSYKSFVIPVK